MRQGSDLGHRIRERFSTLSPKQQQLARLILDDPAAVVFASAQELGERIGASAATVVRFCQALDYEGYPALQAAVRAELPFFLTMLQRAEHLRNQHSDTDLVQRVFEQARLNLERTQEGIDRVAFMRAVDALCEADQILVAGAGLSSVPALYFGHSLRVIGFRCQAVIAGGIPLAVELAHLGPKSVFVGINLWRYVREIVEGMRQAREQGVHTIAVTDSLISPLVQLADEAFVAMTDGVAQSRSPAALIALLEALVAAMSFKRPEQVVTNLRRVDEIYRSSNLVIDVWPSNEEIDH